MLILEKIHYRFLMKMLQKGDIVSLSTGFVPSYIVNSPSFVQEILVTKDAFFRKGRTSKVLTRTIGDGLLTTEKAEHKKQQKEIETTETPLLSWRM